MKKIKGIQDESADESSDDAGADIWVPPGYIHVTALVRKHGVNKIRSDLFAGRLQAYKWDGTAGQLYEIESRVWCADWAGQWLSRGWLDHHSEDCPPCM